MNFCLYSNLFWNSHSTYIENKRMGIRICRRIKENCSTVGPICEIRIHMCTVSLRATKMRLLLMNGPISERARASVSRVHHWNRWCIARRYYLSLDHMVLSNLMMNSVHQIRSPCTTRKSRNTDGWIPPLKMRNSVSKRIRDGTQFVAEFAVAKASETDYWSPSLMRDGVFFSLTLNSSSLTLKCIASMVLLLWPLSPFSMGYWRPAVWSIGRGRWGCQLLVTTHGLTYQTTEGRMTWWRRRLERI